MKNNLRFPCADIPLHVRIGVGRRELAGAYELVYHRYLARGYVDPNPGAIVYREAFGFASSRTIVATTQTEPVLGTLTVVGDNPLGLELETTYPSEVQSLRDQGRCLAEITCLATRPTGRSRRTAVYFELTRFMIHYAYWRGFDDLLLAVHPRHHRFYWRHFRVHPLGPCRPHQFVRGSPSIGCRIDLHTLKQNVNPELWQQYFAEEYPEIEYMGPPLDPADHRYFLGRSAVTLHADLTDHRRWSKDAA
jgi:hypothetical protein